MDLQTQPRVFERLFRAMNCGMGAWVVASDAEAAEARLAAVEAFMHATEAALSRFRPDSDLSRLNAQAGRPVQVSPLLAETLALALDAARQTQGLYDPTMLAALEAAGYDRSFEQLDGATATRPLSVPRSTWRDVQFDAAHRRVTLPTGVRLDLGGIVKGWAADRAATMLAQVGACLVDAGGDLMARGAPVEYPAWPVGVADPRDPDRDLALLMLSDRGVATSGTDYRRWGQGETMRHHIIDPRTRRPAQTDLLSVTVVAPTAVQADLHAKVALMLGAGEGLRTLERLPEVEGLLIGEDGRQWQTAGFGQYVYSHADPKGLGDL